MLIFAALTGRKALRQATAEAQAAKMSARRTHLEIQRAAIERLKRWHV